jgi:hypothetical protein
MARYTFRFDEISSNQVWFEADDIFHAKELMQQVENEEINVSDLPRAEERNRGIQMDFSVSMLESDSIS